MYSTFLEVYENHCARNNREADLPITKFKEQLNQAISGQISQEAVVDLCLQAYNDSISSQYMYKTAQWKLHVGFQEAIYQLDKILHYLTFFLPVYTCVNIIMFLDA